MKHVPWHALLLAAAPSAALALTPIEQLGEQLFFDTNLSFPEWQACAACHSPDTGFTGPLSAINAAGAVYEGAVEGRFGNRKPPSAAYATQAPVLSVDRHGTFSGGNFWDGRATGEHLGNPAADQAQGPFLNPLEQNLPAPATVVEKVCAATYAASFEQVFGASICDDVDRAYDAIALAIAAYEASPAVNAFSSKYDAVLAGTAKLTPAELRGLALFQGKAKCARCHPSGPRGNGNEPPLFTDYTFDNLGLPANASNPFYTQTAFNPLGAAWKDLGLGGFLAGRLDLAQHAPGTYGAQKVPTLRNVDRRPAPDFVKAYGHNGFFKSLKQTVHFYNTRDVLPRCPPDFAGTPGDTCWPAPEVALNVNTVELGDLKLTDADEDDVVAFLKTLSDGWTP